MGIGNQASHIYEISHRLNPPIDYETRSGALLPLTLKDKFR